MSYYIDEAVETESERLKALKKIKKKWPGAKARTYGKFTLWIVDIDIKECTSFNLTDDGRSAIIYKNLAPGINIAAEKHLMQTDMIPYYIKQRPELFSQIKEMFNKEGLSY